MLTIYTLNESEQWDRIVRTFREYDVYYLSGYVKGFQIHGDGEPILVYYDSKECRGINVLMKRDIFQVERFKNKIEEGTLFDVITPYGYGGWLIEGDGNTSELFIAYERWCKKNNIVSEFVRYHPVLNNYKYSEKSYEVTSLGGTIVMDLSSPEIIWENLTSKNRNMIRKAKKFGVKIYNGRYPEISEKFREIYNDTMDKDQADRYYYFEKEFYNSIVEDLAQECQFFYAELGGKIIAAAIILSSNGRLNYHLSGSVREYQNLAPTNLLLYEVALWGTVNGYKTFHLGGGVGSKEDSLYKFKKSFYRGEAHRFCIGKRIFIPEIYLQLIELRKKDNSMFDESGKFFPIYRGET